MIKIEPLSRSHYEQYEGEPPTYTMQGFAAVEGDKVLGICCLMQVSGKNIVMFDFKKDLSCMQMKRLLIKGWQKFKPLLQGKTCYTIPDDEKPTAISFVSHFGFVPMGDIYVYRGD